MVVPTGALNARSRFSRWIVEMRLAGDLFHYHPLGQPITIEAQRTDTGSPVGPLLRPATVRLKLDQWGFPLSASQRPSIRLLKSTGWERTPSAYDSRSQTLTLSLDALPATIALVDESQPPSAENWDPLDPSALQLSDDSWALAYSDGNDLLYRRSLGNQEPLYWLDAVTVEATADSPALVKLGSTLALFYRKTSGSYRQVFLRTSTDDGLTWSGATQLTTETANVYQIQAVTSGGTVYLFWSLSNTSGLLQYRTSIDLATWTTKASVGQAIGPNSLNTYPAFDIKKLSSGTWVLTWLNKATICSGCTGLDLQAKNSLYYPVVWTATSSDLSAWTNSQELTLPYSEMRGGDLSLAQASSGTVYISYSHRTSPWDHYLYYKTSGDDGATWSSKTMYGYEPARPTNGSGAVLAHNPCLAVEGSGGIRAFWDQNTEPGTLPYTDSYPTQLFRRDLPGGAILPISPTKELLSQCGPCLPWAAFAADPVNVATGHFTLPETDLAIAARGPDLVFQRTYNSARLVDGPLGYGWIHNYDTHLTTYTHGEVLILDGSGRSDVYLPATGGGYTPPPGRFGSLVHNGDGTWSLTEPDQTKRTFSSGGRLVSIADRNGNTLSLSYNQSGQLSTVTEATGRSLTFGYDGQHISSITDPLNRTISFGYTNGNLTSVTDRRGKTWSYGYDDSHRLTSKTDPLSHVVFSNTYVGLGRIGSQRDAKNYETKFKYSSSGGISYQTDRRGNTTTYYYDTQYRITQVSDPYAKSIYYFYDASSNLWKVEDRRRTPWNTTTFTYDSSGNVLTRTNGLNKTWTYTYTAYNDVHTVTDPLNHTTTYDYDVNGNLTSVTNAKDEQTIFDPNAYGEVESITDGRGKVTTFGYDSHGYQNSITHPYGKTWTSVYDAGGRLTSTTDPLSHTTSFGYDDNDNLTSITDGRGKVTSYVYDDANNRTQVTDPNLKVTHYTYDERNQLRTVVDAEDGTTTYDYDQNGNLSSITDANLHTRSFTYEKNNRLETETDALSHVTTYVYDGAGNLYQRTDANGATTTYGYDTISRLTSITYPAGSVSYGYNDSDLRTSMTDSTGTTTYAYDELNRLSSVTFPGSRVVSYQYDAAGNRIRITYPDSKAVDYTYDDASRMSTVTDWLDKVTTYGYDDAGRLTSASLPNGVSEARTYNAANQLTSIVATRGGTTLTSFTYTLDDAGVRTAVEDLLGTESYTYDDLYRLTGVSYADGSSETYTYDGVGNRLTKTAGTASTEYTYNDGDRLTGWRTTYPDGTSSATIYFYDDNGNYLRAVAGDDWSWDYENRPVQVPKVAGSIVYAYRADGLRESKTYNSITTTYTWDVNARLPAVLQDGTYTYVYGLGLISQTDGSGNQTYLLGNGLGSTEVLSDEQGNAVSTYKYAVEGKVRSQGVTGSTEYLFAAQQYDADLGMYYLRARYYDPMVARFISKDPFPGMLTNSASLHPYVYAMNSPTNLTDPSGRFPPFDDWPQWVEGLLNATTTPVYAPAEEGQPGDLEDLMAYSEACGTGSARPAIEQAYEGLWWVGLLTPGGGAAKVARYTADQRALIQLAQEARRLRGGVTLDEVKILRQWATELKLPFRGPEMHPGRPFGRFPHIHLGPIDHLPVIP